MNTEQEITRGGNKVSVEEGKGGKQKRKVLCSVCLMVSATCFLVISPHFQYLRGFARSGNMTAGFLMFEALSFPLLSPLFSSSLCTFHASLVQSSYAGQRSSTANMDVLKTSPGPEGQPRSANTNRCLNRKLHGQKKGSNVFMEVRKGSERWWQFFRT